LDNTDLHVVSADPIFPPALRGVVYPFLHSVFPARFPVEPWFPRVATLGGPLIPTTTILYLFRRLLSPPPLPQARRTSHEAGIRHRNHLMDQRYLPSLLSISPFIFFFSSLQIHCCLGAQLWPVGGGSPSLGFSMSLIFFVFPAIPDARIS